MKPSHFATMEAPVGHVLVAASPQGVNRIQIMKEREDLIAAFRRQHPDALELANPVLTEALLQLKEYFAGWRYDLTFPVDLRVSDFTRKVWEVMRNIPYGQTVSYSTLAGMAGNARAYRAAANACATNPVALYHPCHRVLHKDGGISGYYWGTEVKHWLLSHERRHAGQAHAA